MTGFTGVNSGWEVDADNTYDYQNSLCVCFLLAFSRRRKEFSRVRSVDIICECTHKNSCYLKPNWMFDASAHNMGPILKALFCSTLCEPERP